MLNLSLQRVLSLDLRTRRFGYVIFEGPRTLLDWGISAHSNERHSSLERKLNSLHSMFEPSVILVRKTIKRHRISQPNIRPSLHILRAFAKRAAVAFRSIDASLLRHFFFRKAKTNKYDIARMIADRFPELSWRLPPKRKPWQSEAARQSIFDAASLGVFYFAQQSEVKQTVTRNNQEIYLTGFEKKESVDCFHIERPGDRDQHRFVHIDQLGFDVAAVIKIVAE